MTVRVKANYSQGEQGKTSVTSCEGWANATVVFGTSGACEDVQVYRDNPN